MSQSIGRAVLVLSGLGFPLTQLVIRRFGQPGAVVVQTVCGGLLVRDVAMIAAGVPDRLRRGPAILLWLEAAAAIAAIVTGLRPVLDATALPPAVGQDRPDLGEYARRVAIGTLFGLHTVRFRIYLQPDSGSRLGVPKGDSSAPPDITKRRSLPTVSEGPNEVAR